MEINNTEKQSDIIKSNKELTKIKNNPKNTGLPQKNNLLKYFTNTTVSEKKINNIKNLNDEQQQQMTKSTVSMTIDDNITKISDKLSIESDAEHFAVALNKDLRGKRSSARASDNFEGNHPSKRCKNDSHTSALMSSESTKQNDKDMEINMKKKFVPRVPTEKTIRFETARVLKDYLMKYYPSKPMPDRETFTKTCREIHLLIMEKKISGKLFINICVYYKRVNKLNKNKL